MDQGDLKDIERRQLKHWSVDGLPESMAGVSQTAAEYVTKDLPVSIACSAARGSEGRLALLDLS